MRRISDTIKNDHRELEACYEKIVGLIDQDEKAAWRNEFAWELARHLYAEELVIYPAVEKKLQNGKDLVRRGRSKHQPVCERKETSISLNTVLFCLFFLFLSFFPPLF